VKKKSLCRLKKYLLLGLFVLLVTPVISWASTGSPLENEEDQWRFTIAFPMLWAPNINGEIKGENQFDFEVGFDDIFEDLQFGLMGELYANRGRFGVAFKFNYLNASDGSSNSGTLLNTHVKTDVTMGVNDLLASWEVHEKVQLFAGVRHVHAKIDVTLDAGFGGDPLINRKITVSDDNQFDYLVGFNFDHWFTPRWGALLSADVAVAGDNDRDYSTDVRALYRISDLHNVWFGYRYLNIGTDITQNGITTKVDMSQGGPMLGWAFTF